MKLVLELEGLVESLIEENRKNAELFGVSFDHTWDGYLIRYADGKLVSPNALTNSFDRFVKKHNLKLIRYHDLRHSCASILYANGVDILTIQQILGHAQLSTTVMYTHIINDQQHNALSQMSKCIMGDTDEDEDI